MLIVSNGVVLKCADCNAGANVLIVTTLISVVEFICVCFLLNDLLGPSLIMPPQALYQPPSAVEAAHRLSKQAIFVYRDASSLVEAAHGKHHPSNAIVY